MPVGRKRKHSRHRAGLLTGSGVTHLSIAAAFVSFTAASTARGMLWESSDEPPQVDEAGTDGEADSRLHISLGADYTTAYFFRGFAYEDTGLIIQPWAEFALDLVQSESLTVAAILGTWNSLHGQATDSGTTDDFRKYWFEADVTAGIGVEVDQWSLRAVYNWYTSPSDAWDTTEEIMFSAEYEDEGWLPSGWTLLPELSLAVETGSVANDGGRKGTFLELGLSPGFEFEALGAESLDLRFPFRLGLSLSNYYEGENGENDAFGYASIGAELTIPLGLDSSWGDWSIIAGVRGLYLGDVTSTINGGDEFQLIATLGLEIEF